jgi:hypothetical protein
MMIREVLARGRELGFPPPEAPTPFALANPGRVRSILEGAGFADVELEEVDEPLRFGDDGDHAFGFIQTAGIVRGLCNDLDDADKEAGLADLRERVAGYETPEGVLLPTSAWLITARRA